MKYRWIRNFLKGCSLTTALFVFTACYGTPTGAPVEPEEEIVSEVTDQDSNAVVEEDAALNVDASLTEPEEGKG